MPVKKPGFLNLSLQRCWACQYAHFKAGNKVVNDQAVPQKHCLLSPKPTLRPYWLLSRNELTIPMNWLINVIWDAMKRAKSEEQKPLFSSPPPNPVLKRTRGYVSCNSPTSVRPRPLGP